jgi:hypothetical protein
MNHLSFWEKEGRRLGNKNTILRAFVRVFGEPFFDIVSGVAASGSSAGRRR